MLPGPPGNKRVAGEEHGRVLEREADAARRVAGSVHGAQTQLAHRVHGVIVEEVVVTGQHVGVFFANPHVDARLAHGLDGPDVIPVAVGLKHRGHAQFARHLKKSIVFVGGVDQRRLARSATAHDVNVVRDRPHDEAVDLA